MAPILVGDCTNFCGVPLAEIKRLLPSGYRPGDGAMWSWRNRTDGVSGSALTRWGPGRVSTKILCIKKGVGGGDKCLVLQPVQIPVGIPRLNEHFKERIPLGETCHCQKVQCSSNQRLQAWTQVPTALLLQMRKVSLPEPVVKLIRTHYSFFNH